MSIKKIILSSFAAAGLSACASIVNHAPDPVTVTSFPDHTNFSVINRQGKVVHNGITPQTLVLKPDDGYFRGEKYTLKFQKEGFGVQTTPLDSKLNGWYWGNLLFGDAIGMLIVDPLTGAMWSLPESKSVYLVPNP